MGRCTARVVRAPRSSVRRASPGRAYRSRPPPVAHLSCASRRRPSGAALHAPRLGTQLAAQAREPGAVEVAEAEDALAARARPALHQVHPPPAGVALGAEQRVAKETNLLHLRTSSRGRER